MENPEDIPNLDEKILFDFHGNEVIFDKELEGKLPTLDIKAQIKVTSILSQEDKPSALRVSVVGGGCAGLSYSFDLEEIKNITSEDLIISEYPKVIIDNISIKYMPGAIIKYVEDIVGSSFQIDNPGVKQSCSCGTSFSYF